MCSQTQWVCLKQFWILLSDGFEEYWVGGREKNYISIKSFKQNQVKIL